MSSNFQTDITMVWLELKLNKITMKTITFHMFSSLRSLSHISFYVKGCCPYTFLMIHTKSNPRNHKI